jgi:uncharacterized protein (UPF0332 family)
MGSKDIPRALLRKATHQFKEGRALRSRGELADCARHYYNSMLIAAESLLLLHGEDAKRSQDIISGLRRHLADEESFPEEAVSWLEEASEMMEGSPEDPNLTGPQLDDLEDRAEKLLVAAESLML